MRWEKTQVECHGRFALAVLVLFSIQLQLVLSQAYGELFNARDESQQGTPSPRSSDGGQDTPSNDRTSTSLPNAPEPQNISPSSRSAKISASGKLTVYLAPQVTQHPLTPSDKFTLYIHQTTSPFGLVGPALGAGLSMINPKSKYPHDWKAGGDGYGRLFGDRMAERESEKTGRFLAEIAFHEDPRYLPSTSAGFLGRTYHALSFTLVDRSDFGHSMPSISNFAGAAAKGFVRMGYLPPGYNDAIHAEQTAASTFGGYAIGNVLNEFCPEWSPLVMKIHLPFVHPPCPERIHAKQHSQPSTQEQVP